MGRGKGNYIPKAPYPLPHTYFPVAHGGRPLLLAIALVTTSPKRNSALMITAPLCKQVSVLYGLGEPLPTRWLLLRCRLLVA